MVGLPVISRFNKGRQARNTELAHFARGLFHICITSIATEIIGRLTSLTMPRIFAHTPVFKKRELSMYGWPHLGFTPIPAANSGNSHYRK
jgi:hypothetical protein